MALSNLQYNTILREYDETRDRNRRILEKRRAAIYSELDGYKALDEAVASTSMEYGRKLMGGDSSALSDLHFALATLKDSKLQLLKAGGYPEDYLAPVYDCPDCQDTGYIDGRKCHCFKQRMITMLYEQSGIKDYIEENNFDTLSEEFYEGVDLENFRAAVSSRHEFINNFPEGAPNLFLYGTVGTGKSFLSGCVAKELMDKGYSVVYFSAIQLFDLLSNFAYSKKDKESLYNPYEDLYNCDLVIIDDLGTEIANNFVTSKLFQCLNERMLRGKSTIISSNLALEELKEFYSDRIFSRITAKFTFRKLTGPDVRLLIKRKLNTRK